MSKGLEKNGMTKGQVKSLISKEKQTSQRRGSGARTANLEHLKEVTRQMYVNDLGTHMLEQLKNRVCNIQNLYSNDSPTPEFLSQQYRPASRAENGDES